MAVVFLFPIVYSWALSDVLWLLRSLFSFFLLSVKKKKCIFKDPLRCDAVLFGVFIPLRRSLHFFFSVSHFFAYFSLFPCFCSNVCVYVYVYVYVCVSVRLCTNASLNALNYLMCSFFFCVCVCVSVLFFFPPPVINPLLFCIFVCLFAFIVKKRFFFLYYDGCVTRTIMCTTLSVRDEVIVRKLAHTHTYLKEKKHHATETEDTDSTGTFSSTSVS